jgi:hypothetical protein
MLPNSLTVGRAFFRGASPTVTLLLSDGRARRSGTMLRARTVVEPELEPMETELLARLEARWLDV